MSQRDKDYVLGVNESQAALQLDNSFSRIDADLVVAVIYLPPGELPDDGDLFFSFFSAHQACSRQHFPPSSTQLRSASQEDESMNEKTKIGRLEIDLFIAHATSS